MNTLTAKEIKEGMTQGKWKVRELVKKTEYGTYVANVISNLHPSLIVARVAGFTALECKINCAAVFRAIDGTFNNNLDPEKYEEVVKALETTLAALKDVVRQLPTDESLADYRLDFAESAEAEATAALAAAKIK